MLKLGIIGTNWITEKFVHAAIDTKKYELTAVYSRKIETAKAFGQKFNDQVKNFDDVTAFFESDAFEVVYIASPNGLHFEQAKQAIENGKHVIVEKPAFSTPYEMDEIIDLANRKNVFYFEAAKAIFEKSFEQIKNALPEDTTRIWNASFSFAKYSSRMDAVLEGEEPNIFSPKFSGGALMDLGVYILYAVVGLFGKPRGGVYFPTLLPTGVDGNGTGILAYETFNVTIQVGKSITSVAPSQIFLDNGTIVIDEISEVHAVEFISRTPGESKAFDIQPHENTMYDEALAFANVLLHPDNPKQGEKYEEWVQLSRDVNEVQYTLRKSAGIEFAADLREVK
jgi:predicted dehydrogenase